uniref:F-box protein PP2-A12 isoform X2 n=1 Tax=Rhizophora mucronata TaxID=61149 RepID=A0A2P2KVZ5_RHIMU
MGANLSSIFMYPYTFSLYGSFCLPSSPPKPNIGDLPENCVASILSLIDPPEICKLARMNRAFRGASWADFIWESKLPENYGIIFSKVVGEDSDTQLSKREIYARLCRANSFDGGTKVCVPFWSLCLFYLDNEKMA